MSEGLDSIMALPDISFIDNMTLIDCQNFLISRYQENYKAVTGKEIALQKASPRRIELLSVAELMYSALQSIDKAGKMNFLKYAYGDYLNHIGIFKNVSRAEPKCASVPVEFKLSEVRESAVGIDAGITVTADQKVFFKTTEYAEIPAGELSIVLMLKCTTAGSVGNGYKRGEINTLCDPIGFVSEIVNTAESYGGEDETSDDDMKELIYMAPSKYSVAGPDDAWIALTKEYSTDVSDVKVWTGSDSVVNIYVMMKRGRLPTEEFINGLTVYLSQPDKKPTADYIKVQAPECVDYNIELTYYIAESNKSIALNIQNAVNQAIADYAYWQGAHEENLEVKDPTAIAKVGRDINPDELTTRVKRAGAKRAIITSPVYQKVENHQIANLLLSESGKSDIRITYGGIESD